MFLKTVQGAKVSSEKKKFMPCSFC